MASTVPAKSQPLHNFSLPQWKWTKKDTNNQHRGRAADSSAPGQSPSSDSSAARRRRRQSPLPPRQSPIHCGASESESAPESGKNVVLVSSPDHNNQQIEKSENKSKIYIRLRPKNNNKPEDVDQNESKIGAEDGGLADESAAKTWNLRPRKAIAKPTENKAQWLQTTANRTDQNVWLRSDPEAVGGEKKEKKKQKFSISLTRHEIEEDIYSLTGSKPARRPKKRARTLQKQLDNLFPGVWLPSITPDTYKVSEASVKGQLK